MNIAVVNLDSAMAQSAQGKELMQQLSTFQRETHDEISASTDQLQQLRRQITDGATTFSTEQLRSLQRKFEQGRQKLRQFQQDKQLEGERLHEKGLQDIRLQLGPVLHNLRIENEYDVILSTESVLAMADWVDITKAVAASLSQAR